MVAGRHHVVAKQTPSIIVEGTFSGVLTGGAASSEEPLALRFAGNATSLERAVQTSSFQLPREIPLDQEHVSAQFLDYLKDLFVWHLAHPFTGEEGNTP